MYKEGKNKIKTNSEKLEINVINVNGLTKGKYAEIEKTFLEKELNIVCITETKLLQEKILLGKNIEHFTVMREENDTKGGGLMILHKKSDKLSFNKVDSGHKDILVIEGKCNNQKIKIILVYFGVKKTKKANDANDEMRKKVEKIMNKADENEALVVLGDFNAHTGEIGYQDIDHNGKMIHEWFNEYDLILLNYDEKCTGEVTWTRGNQNSTIDYILVNETMYDKFISMTIDEDKEIYDLSDHNLLTARFEIKRKERKNRSKKEIEREYFSKENKLLTDFRARLEDRWGKNKPGTVIEMIHTMNETANEILKKVYKKRELKGEENNEEKPWMNESILQEIKKRREINRARRNEENIHEKEKLQIEYEKQREKVKKLIKEGLEAHEIMITNQIKNKKNGQKKLWEHVDLLRGKKKKEGDISIYTEEGTIVKKEEIKEMTKNTWGKQLNAQEYNIKKVWGHPEIDKLRKGLEESKKIKERMQFREHLDMVRKVEEETIPQEHRNIEKEELKNTIEEQKDNKAPGPDSMKAEFFKELLKSDICLEVMLRCYNDALTNGNIPDEWKESRTKLIPKKKKPTIKDFRPIALTNISYKIFMTLLKTRIENHLTRNNLVKESQTGFTKGGRKEDNLFILQHLVEEAHKNKEKLIITAIDYSKAYDSIDREEMIKALIDYKLHPGIIDRVAKLYDGDFTNILVGEEEVKMKITSGIKQGCPLSTTLFKIITYIILNELEEKGKGFEIDNILLLALFFADDSLLIANTVEKARHNIKILTEASKKFGLNVNETKCKILVFNFEKKRKREELKDVKEIEGIEIVESLKYLGVTIENNHNLFRKHKESTIQAAGKLSNLTYSIISKSANKMLIGKTYWKNIVLPSVLQSIGVIPYTNTEINELQRVENGVYRRILGGLKNTPICTLRGEVGSSMMKTRFIEGKLVYTRSIQTGKNSLVQEILYTIRSERKTAKQKKITWNNQLNEYLNEVNIRYGEIGTLSKKEIKRRVRDWDTNKWKEELDNKSSVKIYKDFKKRMKDDGCYDNKFSSVLLFRARSNTLKLNIRKRHQNGDTKCELCEEEREDLTHFIIDCKELEGSRDKEIMKEHYDTNKEEMIGKILHTKEKIEAVKNMLEKMWNQRQIKRAIKGKNN